MQKDNIVTVLVTLCAIAICAAVMAYCPLLGLILIAVFLILGFDRPNKI